MIRLCLFILLTCGAALAQQPRLVRYAATLPDDLNRSGALGVTFSIFRQQFDGTPLWSEIQNVTTDKNRSYSALLGSTRNEGLPTELFNTTEPRWLEVEIEGVKQPRVLIGSVPYAMVAENAQTFGGLPPSAYLRVAPDPTAGAADRVTPPSTGGVTLRPLVTSGTGGYLAMFTNSTDLANSALFQNGNTVSIGGTTSLGAITLIGNAPGGDAAGMALYNAGGGAGASVSLDLYNTSFNGGIPQAKIKALDDGNYSDHLTFLTKTPGAATNAVAERIRITSSGNVGIGTAAPGAKLEVAGGMKISGTGNGITFPDGTSITSAFFNASGLGNTAVGQNALSANTSGSANSAFGLGALTFNTIGGANTAVGQSAMVLNTVGSANTAVGVYALGNNIVGSSNVAVGNMALGQNSGGSNNTATGAGALGFNANGSNNTAIGYQSGKTLAAGSYNIMIGNAATSSDDHVIRIGDVQTSTYIAGITGVNVSGVPVVVSSTGQLGIASSSRRFKEDIQNMGDASDKIMALRPVKYHYKQAYEDGSKPLDYGLIAEEVAEVYPDLVARSQDGQIQTVMYQKLTPMLLNEVQRLRGQLAQQGDAIRELQNQLAQLKSKR